MNTSAHVASGFSLPALTAAPHRLLFLVGAANVLLAMLWWTLLLLDRQTGWPGLPQTAVPSGWLHAYLMLYQVLPPFFFGFLLTVFPRWMNLPALGPRAYLPVGVGLFGGQLLVLLSLFGMPGLLLPGVCLTALGWSIGLTWLLGLLWRESGRTWHALSCAIALLIGLMGVLLFLAYLLGGNARLLFVSLKLGSYGLLLPVFYTVAHRMFPFFASNVVPGYRAWRPLWLLGVMWGCMALHLTLELQHAYGWLWLADLPLLGISGYWLWRNWAGWNAPPLLRVLFVGYAWLPVALALHSVQSLIYLLDGRFVMGRAPAHALFIGFAGSLLVAMVTRVTQGHSGRPLQLGGLAAFAFVIIQLVSVLRIVAELLPGQPLLQILAACGWLLAFLPWVLRNGWIYLTPRADGQAG
jgi:uncharacterized protein involved in response to NO